MTIALVAEMSDRNDRIEAARPHVYGGSIEVASLRAFRRYQKDATWDIPDAEGILRWVTRKQMRVYGIIARISLSPGGTAKMIDIAHEAHCSTATVSRTVLKVQAWGLYAVDVRRGRNGGITVWKAIGSRFAIYAKAARQKLREMAIRARIKLASLSSSTENVITTALIGRDESFRRNLSFTERFVYERAMLAIEDPEGEREARNPLRLEEAVKLLDWREREPAQLAAEREAAMYRKAIEDGDGELVYRIGVERTMRGHAIAGRWDKWQALADLLYPEHVHA